VARSRLRAGHKSGDSDDRARRERSVVLSTEGVPVTEFYVTALPRARANPTARNGFSPGAVARGQAIEVEQDLIRHGAARCRRASTRTIKTCSRRLRDEKIFTSWTEDWNQGVVGYRQ